MNKQTVKLNYLRMTPRKVRAIADLLKGLPIHEAEAQLMSIRRRAAVPLLKLLRSAVADIKNNKRLAEERFLVESVRVDQGPMLKRYLPRARGTATPIQRKMSHVTMILAEKPDLASPRFKIVVPKKVKLPPGEEKPAKKKRVEKAKKEVAEPKKRPGFFRRIFSRKAGFAK